MFEGDTFEPLQKPIKNKIETIIHDSFLSEFKYHFIIKKLPVVSLINDKFKWNELVMNLYKGFKASFMGHNSVHIAQILNIYPELGIADLIVGLRRDQHALKFYRESSTFQYQGQVFQIEVAEGFKTYLDELNQKYRLQAAQRQKIRAEENQLLIKNLEVPQKPKNSPTFVRQSSNPISVYKDKSERSIPQVTNPQQGQIIETPYKAASKRKNSSVSRSLSSPRSISPKKAQIDKSNSKQNSSYESRSDRFNRNNKSNYEKPYKKPNKISHSRSSSSRKSSRSVSSSRSSRRHSSYRRNDRNERSRDNKRYRKDSSSPYSSSSSLKSSRRQFKSSRMIEERRRPRDEKSDKYDNEKRYEENRRYEIYNPPSYNRTYSSGYHNNESRYRDQAPTDLSKKYSYDAYDPYRAPTNRYEPPYYDYQKSHHQHSSSGYSQYYKSVPNYGFPKPQAQFQKKQSYNSSNISGSRSPSQQSQFKYGNTKGNYY